MARLKSRKWSIALVAVLSFFAIRAVAGDEIHGFVDGLVVGFTDDV